MPDISSHSRRRFLSTLAATSAAGLSLPVGVRGNTRSEIPVEHRSRVNALLLSATTVPGRGSMEHAVSFYPELYEGVGEILLINFASLPEDRDRYEARMQGEFSRIGPGFKVRSLHREPVAGAARAVREAEAFFVSGGNTFLLLRELYDRFVVDLLRERVLLGIPYAGSSAGSNIAGTVIGCTNDFPLVDIPTRRSLGILPAVFNPHHPDPETAEQDFESRQWKINQYATYHPDEVVIGVTDPGLVRIRGTELTLLGDNARAFVQQGGRKRSLYSGEDRDLSAAFSAVG